MAPNDAQPAPPGLPRDLKPSKVLVSVFRRADIIPRHLSSDFHREGVARKGRERPGGSETLTAELTIKRPYPPPRCRSVPGCWEALTTSFPGEARNSPPPPPQPSQHPGWRLRFWAGLNLCPAVLSSPLRMDQAVTTAPVHICGHLQGRSIDMRPTVAGNIRCCFQTHYPCFLPLLTGGAGPQFPKLHARQTVSQPCALEKSLACEH